MVWAYENREIPLGPVAAIIVRILIGKVKDGARLGDAFARTPIRAGEEGYEDWNCISWLQEALSMAADDGEALGRCKTDWIFVRDTALWYVAMKAAGHRFDGQGEHGHRKVPTWDALKGKEVIS